MGNTHVKSHPRGKNKKQVHWKAADRPSAPGKPQLAPEGDTAPDLVTLRWQRPISDGGSPVSGYLVEQRRTGSPHWIRATPLLVHVPEVTLSGLEPGWRYQFRVSAENAVGLSEPSEISEPITVTLQRSAVSAPRFTQELVDTTALENEKAEFVAHFLGQPPPKVCWFKDAFEIFSSRRIRIVTESDRSVLLIHQTSLNDEGEIRCTATNRAGHVATKAKLTVEAPPSIRLPRQYEDGLLFEKGETIRLKVSVAGQPTPLVFWTHNGESIQNNDRYEVDYTDKTLVLKIADAKRTDRGEYGIRAVNKLGEDHTSFLVTITDKPSPPGRARVVMTLGRSVTLSWTSPDDDGGCKIGNYIIEYYRLGWNVWLKAATTRQISTVLGDLIEGSEYKFRVKAESPYGISEPSGESDTVFIPDPKRGIVEPPSRSRSQPRDILESVGTPVAARRKNKSRSQSSSRAESVKSVTFVGIDDSIVNAGIPKRPERTKIKTPPKTPERSPILHRKEPQILINKELFDRSSIARDLAYGSPEIKVRKEIQHVDVNNSASSAGVSKTPSPILKTPSPVSKTPSPISTPSPLSSPIMGKNEKQKNEHTVYRVKIEEPKEYETAKPNLTQNANNEKPPSPKPDTLREYIHKESNMGDRNTVSRRSRSPSPGKLKRMGESQEGGSSEFMLVLYSDANEKDGSGMFELEYPPPPTSLSAPELGMEPPIMFQLRGSSSSSELLHERAMTRIFKAAEAEEAELAKRAQAADRRASFDIPKIQINSDDDYDIAGLERKQSLRRRSSGGITHQQALWAQKRQSLKDPMDLSVGIQSNLTHKEPTDMKREIMMNRQRSESEEKEEQFFESLRQKMILHSQSSFEKKEISVAEEERWLAEYEESMSESESEGSQKSFDDRGYLGGVPERRVYSDEDDDETDTYHPGFTRNSAPFEILTKPRDLPDPNFVPKPILKKKENDFSPPPSPNISSPATSPKLKHKKERSSSPIPGCFKRNRSKSLALPTLEPLISSNENLKSPAGSRRGSLISAEELSQQELPKLEKFKPVTQMATLAPTQMSVSRARSPLRIVDKREEEEERKVVADHYADIVRSYGQRRKSNPKIYLERDQLKKAAEESETPKLDESTEAEKSKQEVADANEEADKTEEVKNSMFSFLGFGGKTSGEKSKQKATENSTDQKNENGSNISTKKDETEVKEVTNKRKNSLFGFLGFGKNKAESEDDFAIPDEKLEEEKESETQKETVIVAPKKPLRPTLDKTKQFETVKESTSITSQQSKGNTEVSRQITAIRHDYDLHTPRSSEILAETPKISKRSGSVTRRSRTTSMSSTQSNKSPLRSEPVRKLRRSQEKIRKTSPSPRRRLIADYKDRSKSPSPVPMYKRRPVLREMMTQTSEGLESFSGSISGNSTPTLDRIRQEVLTAQAEVKVRNFIDYLTDLAMFSVACWLYLFKNELLAIPVLLVMVYRQLENEIRKRIPEWMVKKFSNKK